MKRVASLVSWPLPVLSCRARAFLALSRRVLLCVFGLFLAVGVAFQLPGWEGRRVRFLFLFLLVGTDPSTGFSRYPFTYVAVVFLFAVAFVFLFFFVLRLCSILLFTGDFYLSALYQLKYVKYNASVGNTGHFDEVTDLAFSTLLVTGCVPQYVLRDYRHFDHDQEDLGGKPHNFSAALALGACLLFARSIGTVCLRKTPSQTLSCILFTMRKRLCFETLSALQEYLSPVATAR